MHASNGTPLDPIDAAADDDTRSPSGAGPICPAQETLSVPPRAGGAKREADSITNMSS